MTTEIRILERMESRLLDIQDERDLTDREERRLDTVQERLDAIYSDEMEDLLRTINS